MKKLVLFIAAALILGTAQAQLNEIPNKEIPEEYGYIVKIGQTIPNFEFELIDGTKTSMKDLRGKVVMLQFTASWCSVCRKEMPHIEKDIWQIYKGRDDFALIGVDMDEPLKKVKGFSKDMKISYPLALDPGAKIFYTIAAQGAGVTRNIIIDKNGKIVYMTRLFKQEEFDEMKKVIALLMD